MDLQSLVVEIFEFLCLLVRYKFCGSSDVENLSQCSSRVEKGQFRKTHPSVKFVNCDLGR